MLAPAAFILGVLIGILYAYVMFPGGVGDPPSAPWMTWYPILYQGMIILPISAERALHIHHWMVYLPVAIACLMLTNVLMSPNDEHAIGILILLLIFGFSTRMTLHGLSYKDRFSVITDNPYHVSNAQEDASFSAKRMVKVAEQKI